VAGFKVITEDHVPMAEPNRQILNPDDYDPFFWKQVIFTSALYGALNIWPSRDNIQTLLKMSWWRICLADRFSSATGWVNAILIC